MLASERPGLDTAELGESYAFCARETERYYPEAWAAGEVLPDEVRPHFHAVVAFYGWTDRISDESEQAARERLLTRWCEQTLAAVRSGGAEHPVLRAFADTVRRWDLDVTLIERLLAAERVDSEAQPTFATFADLRCYLREVNGTFYQLLALLLGPRDQELARSASLLGEAMHVLDLLEDFPADLAAGRCYLPREDLKRLGLEVGDLQRVERYRQALDELVKVQVGRARELLEQAMPVAGMVHLPNQAFMHALILGAQLQLDEAEMLGATVMVTGLEPLTLASSARRRAVEDLAAVPEHVAVIMDGNRRWAGARGLSALDGHIAGFRAVMRLIDSALRVGIRHLTVFAFSTENWARSQEEVAGLFDTAADGLTRYIQWLQECGVRVRWCGRRDRLDESTASALALVESMTSANSVLTLTFCVDYGGRDELVAAARALAAEAAAGRIRPEAIDADDIARNLYVPDLPDVDLLIRTSGEQRISNFLPWHLTYAEMVFDPALWPDFGYRHLEAAVREFSGRRRRFGGDLPGQARPVQPARAD
ncbi:di-trans,poly-cis-decaprenylcistransferase [Streptomyces sp. NEAU-YJ-81]|nr:di-trans,poly-cis-decaprenylcistransferase [Streptomyces sp. NEAU-YJ-81]